MTVVMEDSSPGHRVRPMDLRARKAEDTKTPSAGGVKSFWIATTMLLIDGTISWRVFVDTLDRRSLRRSSAPV